MFKARTPQSVIDTQNGTISNCVLEIPQNVKLEISGGVITLKAGSIVTNSGSTYQTITATQDTTSSALPSVDGRYLIFARPSDLAMVVFATENCFSGTTDGAPEGTAHIWFDTNSKEVRQYFTNGSYGVRSYPVCLVEVSNGVASFAKDSNGNDMIFNGACFVGHHIVKYPNIKALVPKGLNTDGSMSSYNVLTASLEIIEMRTNINFCTITNSGSSQARVNYREVDELDNVVSSQYLKPQNLFYFYTGNAYVLRYETPFVFFTYNGSTVTQFDMVKPVRMATVEMLDRQVANIQSSVYHRIQDRTTLYNTFINSGNITLSEDFTNFEYIGIYVTNSTKIRLSVYLVNTEILDEMLDAGGASVILFGDPDGTFWEIFNYDNDSTKQLFEYAGSNDAYIDKIVGFNRKAV